MIKVSFTFIALMVFFVLLIRLAYTEGRKDALRGINQHVILVRYE